MKITNTIPVVTHIPFNTHIKAGVTIQHQMESTQVYPSLKKAIAAYTIVSQAHQLVTMAINISYELLQKAFSYQDHTDIMAKISTINNYFTRLSPGTGSIPNIPHPETFQESTKLIEQLGNAIQNNDTETVKEIHDRLLKEAHILDNTHKQLYMALNQAGSNTPDITNITTAIKEHQDKAFYAHTPFQYEHILKLLS